MNKIKKEKKEPVSRGQKTQWMQLAVGGETMA
jgi:hypothetical protein